MMTYVLTLLILIGLGFILVSNKIIDVSSKNVMIYGVMISLTVITLYLLNLMFIVTIFVIGNLITMYLYKKADIKPRIHDSEIKEKHICVRNQITVYHKGKTLQSWYSGNTYTTINEKDIPTINIICPPATLVPNTMDIHLNCICGVNLSVIIPFKVIASLSPQIIERILNDENKIARKISNKIKYEYLFAGFLIYTTLSVIIEGNIFILPENIIPNYLLMLIIILTGSVLTLIQYYIQKIKIRQSGYSYIIKNEYEANYFDSLEGVYFDNVFSILGKDRADIDSNHYYSTC